MIVWIKKQFTEERMNRYIDGSNPGRSYGYESFFGIREWQSPHKIWSVVHIGAPNGMRSVYYLSGEISHSQDHFAAATLKMRSKGMVATITIHFKEKENAPKKLNKAIRFLRESLGI